MFPARLRRRFACHRLLHGARTCLLAAAIAVPLDGFAGQGIRACASTYNTPPFAYIRPADKELRGVAIDLLRQTFPLGRMQLSQLPWNRCIALAKLGQVDIIINVPTAQIDPTPFLITRAFAQLNSVYITSRRHWPQGITIRTVEDLKRYRLCGLKGNRYESYGIQTDLVDRGAGSYGALIAKLLANRCDLVIDKREIVDALSAADPSLARVLASAALSIEPLPEDSPIGLHFAVSRSNAQAAEIRARLDQSIAASSASGQLAAWTRTHRKALGMGESRP